MNELDNEIQNWDKILSSTQEFCTSLRSISNSTLININKQDENSCSMVPNNEIITQKNIFEKLLLDSASTVGSLYHINDIFKSMKHERKDAIKSLCCRSLPYVHEPFLLRLLIKSVQDNQGKTIEQNTHKDDDEVKS